MANSNAEKVAAEVKRVCGGTIHTLLTDGDGMGRVMVKRENPYHPYAVWRWHTKLTDGSPVTGLGATGAMLLSGDYYATESQAQAGLGNRGRTT